MGAGYWSKKIKKFFPEATDIKEDWEKETVEFIVCKPGEETEIDYLHLVALTRVLLGTAKIRIKAIPDLRYYGDREYDRGNMAGAYFKFFCTNVSFPE